MKKSFVKCVLHILLVTMMTQPFLTILQVRAATDNASQNNATIDENDFDEKEESISDADFSGDPTSSQPASLDDVKYDVDIDKDPLPPGLADVMNAVIALNPDPDKEIGMGIEDGLAITGNPRLVINPSDYTSIKTLGILAGTDIVPNFYIEFQLLFDNLSADTKKEKTITNVDDLRNFSTEHPDDFNKLVQEGHENWYKENSNDIKDLVKSRPDLISQILDISIDYANSLVNSERGQNSDISQLAQSWEVSTEEATSIVNINKQQYEDLMIQIDDAISGLRIDVRVLKLLVYLVTPKSQYGAGHWRIQVRGILAGYASPRTQFKKESDLYSTDSVSDTTIASLTAADIGQNRSSSAESTSTKPEEKDTATEETEIEDSALNDEVNQVDSYEASFSTTGEKTEEEEDLRMSVHHNGQAVDIMQVDDVRCTLIKKKRIGGTSRTKHSQRPIKLAWQTTQGFIDSGGQAEQNADMAKILKDYAQEGIRSLITEFGGDITKYSGDLSSASFSDVALLLGKSLFGEIINSPGGDLKGYNFGDTLEKLGAMFFADYLGLPREMFVNRRYDNLDKFQEAIGAAAIEKRMNLPIGTFDGDNLNDMLKNIGQRKLEYEMNLKSHDLDLYFIDTSKYLSNVNLQTTVIGAAVIENELGLESYSYLNNNEAPANFAALKKVVGKYKADILFKDPVYIDGVLHLDPGTTKKLTSNQMTPTEFANIIGKKRLDDTVYGLQFLGMKDTAYEIPFGTFQRVLDGDTNALIEIGISQMARVFTSTDLERLAFIEWIKSNKDSGSCDIPDDLVIYNVPQYTYFQDESGKDFFCNAETLNINGCTKDQYGKRIVKSVTTIPKVTLSEKKALDVGFNSGDMFILFGCSKGGGRAVFNRIGSNILYFAIIQQALSPKERIKLDLTEINPKLRSSDPKTEFYVNRIYHLIELKNRLKSNWSELNNDPQYIIIKNAMDGIATEIENVLSNPMNITDINSSKAAARNLAVSINSFAGSIQQAQSGISRYRNKINGMLIDIQDLVKTVSEIMEGREIKTTNLLTLSQIPTNVFGGISVFTTQATTILNNPVGVNTKTGIRPTNIALMAILARKLSPAQFFKNLAATKLEGELNLPTNSMIYFINNYESKGLGGSDAFVVATGQARIEEEFGMPANYFQGPILSGANFALAKPDFYNDMYALQQYLDPKDREALKPVLNQTSNQGIVARQFPNASQTGQILSSNATITNPQQEKHSMFSSPNFASNYAEIFSTDGTAKSNSQLTEEQQQIVNTEHLANQLLWAKINQPKVFDGYVAIASKNFAEDMQRLIDTEKLNKYLENDINHVVVNIENFRLNDVSRSPSADLLFRMGIMGSLDALQSDSSVAWLSANARATQIDHIFGIAQGSTKQLITSKKVSATYARDSLTPDEKNLLSARMGITTAAIDKLLDVLNGNLPLASLNQKALDIVPVGDNPYLKSDTTDIGSDDCSISFTEQNGFITSSTLIMNSFLYVDSTGTHSFGSQTAAINYAQANEGQQVTYLQTLQDGIRRLYTSAGISPSFDVSSALSSYLSDTTQTAVLGITSPDYSAIQTKTGVTQDTLDKLFSRSEASDITRPLVAYKKAVGREVLFQTLSYKLFGEIGLKITREFFHVSDFYDIMHGNFKSLEKIAGALIDEHLDLPRGSTQAILFASSSSARKCALAEVGGNILGRYLGIGYISLHGNIYQNLGRSNLERILKIPRDTFAGKNMDELLTSLGEVNFVNSFSVPIDRLDLDPDLTLLFDEKTIKGLKGYSNTYKLQTLQNAVSANAGILVDTIKSNAYKNIQKKLREQIKYAAAKIVKDGAWRQKTFQLQPGENRTEVNKFIVRVDSLDDTFHFQKYTTASMIAEVPTSYTETFTCPDSGVIQIDYCKKTTPTPSGCNCTSGLEVTATFTNTAITPNDYVSKAANNTAKDFLLLKGMEFFGLDSSDPRNIAIVNTLTNFSKWISEGNSGYANLFQNLSMIFGINLDEKAGLDPGTFKAIIENPGNAFSILMPQATRKIDEMLDLNPNNVWSVSGVYRNYLSPDVMAPDGEYRGAYLGKGGYGTPYNSPGTSAKPTDPALLAAANIAARSNECPYTAEDQARINALNAQAKAIKDWFEEPGHKTYMVLLDQTTAEGTKIVVTQPNDFENSPEYKAKKSELANINTEIDSINRAYNACKAANRGADSPWHEFVSRFNWSVLRNIAEDWASDKIHDAIIKATKNTIDMPPQDIKKFFTNGDMRYFWVASLAYAANYVVSALNSSETELIPPSLRISYADIKLAYFSDPTAEQYAGDGAVYDYLFNDGTKSFEDALINYNFGDVCHGDDGILKNVVNCIFSQDFNANQNSATTITGPTRSTNNLNDFTKLAVDKKYDFNVEKQAKVQTEIFNLEAELMACGNSDSADCREKREKLEQITELQSEAKQEVRHYFLESMQFRIFDGVLWGKDHNIFPGFTHALIKGSAQVKAQAIAMYIKNGIINGQFFGQDIPWLKDIKLADKLGMLSVLSFANELRQGTDKIVAFDKFAGSVGFAWLNNYIASRSKEWFGFSINSDMVGGLILGATTGVWGSFGNKDLDNKYTGANKKLNIPTLGYAVFDFGSRKIFAWADTQLGWDPGTAYKIYDLGKSIFDMKKTLKQIDNITDTAVGMDMLAQVKEANPLGAKALERNGGDAAKAKAATKQMVADLIVGQLSEWITPLLYKALGLASLEKKLGLVPGSTQILIGAAVTYQLGVIGFHNTTWFSGPPNPATLYLALAMFILVNLFGVYKVELKCTADGYYPEIEKPNENLDSQSGLGVWDGLDSTVAQEKTVAAAQYKAKQLIIDALNMHNSPNYDDVYPSQIMTGRDEDVLTLNQQIADNLCSIISKSTPAIHGICDGDSMAGVWYDSYVSNRGYTHIGF